MDVAARLRAVAARSRSQHARAGHGARRCVRARRARADDRLRRCRPGGAAPRRARVDGARRSHLRRASAAPAHARRGAARRRHRAARARRGSRRGRRGRAEARLRGARARDQQAPRPARGLHPRRRRLRLGSGRALAQQVVRRRRLAPRRPSSLPCTWAAIRSTSPTRAPRARTPRRPRAASIRRRASRRSRPSISWPRRSSPARSTAACCRSRTRSPGSCPTRSRSSRRAPSRSSPRSPCTSRTASSDPSGATLETVRVVHSHPMALAQCRSALNGRYERVAASTTSEAARTVAALGDVTVAAIASPLAAQRTASRSSPRRSPTTPRTSRASSSLARFTRLDHDAHTDWHTALRLITKHEPGALHSAIEPLRYHDVQMTSLHSRPIMGEPWRYQFYIDVVGHRSAARVLRALRGRVRAQRRAARARLVSREPRSAVSAVAAAAPRRLGSPRSGRALVRPPERRPRAGHGARAAAVPGRRPRLQLCAAGALLLFSSIGSSFLQPLLGAFADRIRAGWMMPVGTLAGRHRRRALGPVRVVRRDRRACSSISSIGVAMYHPEAVRFASYVSVAGGRQGTGMSMFAVGGLSGWALGPILTTPVVGRRRPARHGRSWPSCRSPPRSLVAVNLRYLEGFRPTRRVASRRARRASARATGAGFTRRRDRGHAAHRSALRASRRSCRSTSGARWTRARARATRRSRRCWPPARSARCSAAGSPTCTASAASSSTRSSPPRRSALLIPVVPLLALIPVIALFGLDQRDELLSDRRDRPARAAAQRRLRLGRDARPQHRPRLAGQPAARRARRQHVAAHRARRRRRPGGARCARLARAAAQEPA